MFSNKNDILKNYESNRVDFVNNDFYNYLPNIFREESPSPIKNMGLSYKNVIESYVDNIVGELDDTEKTETKQTYDGKPVRVCLKEHNSVKNIVEFFEDLFNSFVLETQVNRNCITNVPSYLSVDECDRNNYWITQYWHIDNFINKHFSIGIYLNDVEDGGGQFEYLNNPEYYFYNMPYPKIGIRGNIIGNWKTTRFDLLQPSESEITKILGPKCTTFFFVPNFIHRGTFARTKQRDFIRLLF